MVSRLNVTSTYSEPGLTRREANAIGMVNTSMPPIRHPPLPIRGTYHMLRVIDDVVLQKLQTQTTDGEEDNPQIDEASNHAAPHAPGAADNADCAGRAD